MPRIPSWLRTFLHSIIGIAVAMIVIGLSLNFLRNKGPQIIQGPAGTAGSYIFGSKFNF